jgi:NAD(P)-dependent dehydrogenase (short-subunit alcohol dehydrogenase family)
MNITFLVHGNTTKDEHGTCCRSGATAPELAKAALGEEGQKACAAMTPLQRIADPAEIGAVAAFLASSDSSFTTASEVAVDGGLAQL